ncbi:MAG: efflux RND transporter permease subunit, partial [Candidatus Hydrogenedentota bacterium]
MQRFIGTIINHQVLANMLALVILVTGAVGGFSMLRESFPEIKPTSISVTVVYPGADVEEIENGIARKLEEAVDGLEGVKRYTTISTENVGRAIVEVRNGFSMSKAKDLIENAVDAISTFPAAAEKPVVSEALLTREMLRLTLWGEMDERTRKETAEQIKDELQADPSISKVSIIGVREYEITIELSEQVLRKYELTFDEVMLAIRQGSINLSGGSVRTSSEKIALRVKVRKYTGRELADIVVVTRPSGQIITLGELATIHDEFTEDPVYARFNGEPAVLLSIAKTSEEDSISIVNAGYAYVEAKSKTLPKGIHLTAWADSARVIDDRLLITTQNGAIGLLIVLLCLWTFLNSRLSFWVAMGIPISICGSLTILWLTGATLNSVTLFGLVMVLGIIVDDAIVIAEAVYLRRTQGDGPLMAAVNGLFEVGFPVIAGVTTTIVAFVPMWFIPGTMGQFMGTMATAVIGALLTSLIEALFILPAHLSNLPEAGADRRSKIFLFRLGGRIRSKINGAIDYLINVTYKSAVRFAVVNRYITLCTTMLLVFLTVGLGGAGYIKFTPFPSWDENLIQASIEFPKGTSAEVTRKAVLQMEQSLRDYIDQLDSESKDALIEHVFTITGQTANQQGRLGTHLGMISVQLQHSNIRTIHSKEIVSGWERHTGKINGALSQTFYAADAGPGGSPIEIWLRGDDTKNLRAISKEIREKLLTYEGVYQIEDSFRPGNRELKINVKPESRPLGITQGDLARQVYAGFYGLEADRIQRGRDDIRIKVRYDADERSSLAQLKNLRIRTPSGSEVPFFSVAEASYGAGPAAIDRADGRRRIMVTADVDESRGNATEILNELQRDFFPHLLEKYSGFTISLEGSRQSSNESIGGLIALFPIAMLAIFIIIATLFRSYAQPMIVMITV